MHWVSRVRHSIPVEKVTGDSMWEQLGWENSTCQSKRNGLSWRTIRFMNIRMVNLMHVRHSAHRSTIATCSRRETVATTAQNKAIRQYKNKLNGQLDAIQSYWSPLYRPAAKRAFSTCHFPRKTQQSPQRCFWVSGRIRGESQGRGFESR